MVITQHTHTQKHTQTHTHTHTDTSRHTHRSITAPTRLACIARTHSHTYAYHTTHTRTHARIHTTLRLQAAAAPARLAPYSTHAYMGITHTHTHTHVCTYHTCRQQRPPRGSPVSLCGSAWLRQEAPVGTHARSCHTQQGQQELWVRGMLWEIMQPCGFLSGEWHLFHSILVLGLGIGSGLGLGLEVMVKSYECKEDCALTSQMGSFCFRSGFAVPLSLP